MASPLGKLFGKSPIAPIQQHMQLAQESVQLLCEVLTACADADFSRAEELQGVIRDTVADTRELRRDIRRHLPGGLLLAMPRPDLLMLLDIQERIAECAAEACAPVVLRKMRPTGALQRNLDQYCTLLAAAVGEALTAIRDLDEMLTQGFGTRERRVMEKMLAALHKQLARCETQQQKLLRHIVKSEADHDPLESMFHYQIAQHLAALSRALRDLGEQLDLLIAK